MPDDDWGASQDPGETAPANTATLDCALVTAGQSTGYMRWAGNDRSLFRCVITHVSHVSHSARSRGVVADNQPSASPQKTGRLDSGPNQKKEKNTIPTDGNDHGIIITWPSFGNTPHKILIQARKSSQGRKQETKTLARFRFVPTHRIASSVGSPFPVPSTCTGDHEAIWHVKYIQGCWYLCIVFGMAGTSLSIRNIITASKHVGYCKQDSVLCMYFWPLLVPWPQLPQVPESVD
ncbi:predicted protein [Histoplasma capsulatum var. duboisii H88]|uniref:Predicted protein n=1 Tax=Ajellomyces capsulatus (strain H88) TaxID=544711 RepID=F0UTQ9_AJEC8|nr:predicted protein [Histoplasma capsulatum var. duboisii H88]